MRRRSARTSQQAESSRRLLRSPRARARTGRRSAGCTSGGRGCAGRRPPPRPAAPRAGRRARAWAGSRSASPSACGRAVLGLGDDLGQREDDLPPGRVQHRPVAALNRRPPRRRVSAQLVRRAPRAASRRSPRPRTSNQALPAAVPFSHAPIVRAPGHALPGGTPGSLTGTLAAAAHTSSCTASCRRRVAVARATGARRRRRSPGRSRCTCTRSRSARRAARARRAASP